MNLIDSNIIIAYFREEEANYFKARELIDNLENFIISDYVLLEIATVILLRENKKIAKSVVNFI